MITKIEIDGFKSFEKFSLLLQPFSAIVGINASGKSNLFDAIKLISLLSQTDVLSAMGQLRGKPGELFRNTSDGIQREMRLAVEVALNRRGSDSFGSRFELRAQRLRYELGLELRIGRNGNPTAVYVAEEKCFPISKKSETHDYLKAKKLHYLRKADLIETVFDSDNGPRAILVKQDGYTKRGATRRGRPTWLPASEATRTALSTITTAEFPHLYALREMLASIKFLEINPTAARRPSDRFAEKLLRPDASNLAAALANLKQETAQDYRPSGALAEISMDLASLIPSVREVIVEDDSIGNEYSFKIITGDDVSFSSRVISDGTLRLLALLTVLDDPRSRGVLCFEEPENGVHEGRIEALVSLLRAATSQFNSTEDFFQVMINTHSPAVMSALHDNEIIAADLVRLSDPEQNKSTFKTRMRTGLVSGQLDLEYNLTRGELEKLLRHQPGHA